MDAYLDADQRQVRAGAQECCCPEWNWLAWQPPLGARPGRRDIERDCCSSAPAESIQPVVGQPLVFQEVIGPS